MKLADRGVIPRILSLIFRRGKKLTKDTDGLVDVDVALSYYEIYNDKVYDLLEPPEKRTPTGLPLREKDNKTYVIGLSERQCEDLRDFERLYIAANHNRVTASTKLNAHSSRSHAILRVKLTQTTRSDDGSGSVVSVLESTASAIDLAGSEDNRRTDNGRERLVESAAINKSLFVLSQCVDAIARGERRIPYRESKMTRILSLGQNKGITVMILNLAPLRSYHLDTLSSLNVSSRAKRIEVREIENEVVFKQVPRTFASTSSSSAFSSSASSMASLTSSSTVSSSLSSPSAGTGPARQPLRALSTNTHNTQMGNAAAKAAADKPVKAFAVYADCAVVTKPATSNISNISYTSPSTNHIPARPAPPAAPSTITSTLTSARMGPLSGLSRPSLGATKIGGGGSGITSTGLVKRVSEASEPRSKLARPSIHPYSAPNTSLPRPSLAPATPPMPATTNAQLLTLSAEQIEAIVERKVAEALAARAEEDEKRHEEQRQKLARLEALELAAGQDNTVAFLAGDLTKGNSGEMSEALQKRLEALERRIEDNTSSRGSEDPRAEGLRYLLLARQNRDVGDDAAVLRYYELALPFFPGQAKLLGKIDRLKAKLNRDTLKKRSSLTLMSTGASPTKKQQQQQLSVQKRKRLGGSGASTLTPTTPTFRRAMSAGGFSALSAGDEELDFFDDAEGSGSFENESDADAEDDIEDDKSVQEKTASLSSVPRRGTLGGLRHHRKAPRTSHSDDADDESMVQGLGVMTPRKKKLLDVGKTRGGEINEDAIDDSIEDDLVQSEDEQDETMSIAVSPEDTKTDSKAPRIDNLAQLRNVPRMGGETVERAYEGLSMAII